MEGGGRLEDYEGFLQPILKDLGIGLPDRRERRELLRFARALGLERLTEAALETPARSPLEAFRLARLRSVLHRPTELTRSKLAELADKDFTLVGDPAHLLVMAARGGRPGQWEAYVEDLEAAHLIFEISRKALNLLNPAESDDRLRRSTEIIEGAFEGVSEPEVDEAAYRKAVVRAFQGLKDARSPQVARRIEDVAYRLRPLPSGSFEEEVRAAWKALERDHFDDPATQDAIYFPRLPGEARPVLFARTRPLLLPWNLGPVGIRREMMAMIVHEDQHHEDVQCGPTPVFPAELKARARESLWKAEQGDDRDLRRFCAESPLGFGLAFRDDYEVDYGNGVY